MKSLFLLSLLGISLLAESPSASTHGNQGLDMQLNSEIVFEEMVKVYNYEGELVKEFELSRVVNNEISLEEYLLMNQSDFAFNYLGDYYYFSE